MSGAQPTPQEATPRVWGLLAEFDAVGPFLAAAARVREAGFTRFDGHSPIPVHGLDEAMGIRPSKIPLVALAGGVTGAGSALLLQWWTNAVNYPLRIAGKPFFGLPANIPITFELTVLLAAIGAVAALIIANGWPQLYHPLLTSERFRHATSHKFFISIEAADPRFELERTREFLEELGSSAVEVVEE